MPLLACARRCSSYTVLSACAKLLGKLLCSPFSSRTKLSRGVAAGSRTSSTRTCPPRPIPRSEPAEVEGIFPSVSTRTCRRPIPSSEPAEVEGIF
eukprot:1185325-Prorocentrum_minimum.AAC.1